MRQSIISYDKVLPEIPGRRAWERPQAFLVKDAKSETGWRVDTSGRRPSSLLLVNQLRDAVDKWRNGGYPGASEVSVRLMNYWFEEDHEVPNFPTPFHYHFGQREAIETLIYLSEVYGRKDSKELIEKYATVVQKNLLAKSVEFVTVGGRRRIIRYVPELNRDAEQDLPPEELRRYAFKMATGSGKTWVMAMAMVWSYFHKKNIPNSDLSTNFLIVAPNVIVYQRLAKDFSSNQIFNELPLVPPEWRPWNLKVILRGDSTEPDASGNIFLTNIHQIHESRQQDWSPTNAVDALLGRAPSKDLSSYVRSMLDRIKDLKDLVVLNDEAHHVHDEELAWSQSLLSIHKVLPNGLNLWLDFSATPKDQNGTYYAWTICDYPLAQAVEDRIVKAPIIVTKEDDPERPRKDPDQVTKENAARKYGYWIHAAVQRWKEHYKTYRKLGKRPVLFIMAEKNAIADAIGEHLVRTTEYGLRQKEVLVIHTDRQGEISEKAFEQLREDVRDIDSPSSRVKVIVSVMMLREGWDVRNVSVVLGLRPFSAAPEILPEQVIGRGLRLMTDVGPDTQTLEVLGTQKLLEVLRRQLEIDGVGVGTARTDPPQPVQIYPADERSEFDITIPITKPRLTHSGRKLDELDVDVLSPVFELRTLEEPIRLRLKMDFATTGTEVHQAEIASLDIPIANTLVSVITQKVIQRARLTDVFAQLVPLVRRYLQTKCFGGEVDLDNDRIRSYLDDFMIQEAIVNYLAERISRLTIERREVTFENESFRLSDTKRFPWRRNLPPLTCERTVFNHVATYNDFERRFAIFLDKARDVARFAALGTTEQGASASVFKVDYLKPNGAIGFYYPDFVAVQKNGKGEVNWIIETKGRIWPGTGAKYEAIQDWCRRVSQHTETNWRFCPVNQKDFDFLKPRTLGDLTSAQVELDASGVAWISGTRTKVIEVALERIARGSSAEEIHLQYPYLSLSKILAALEYYYQHQSELDTEIQRRLKEVNELAAKASDTPLRQRLRRLKNRQ
jgi:type III restriction enzyme